MKQSNMNDNLQLAASVGVIIGLILVMYEIRETNKIAENQAAIEMNSLYSEWTKAMMDESMAELWLKSFDSPEELTRVDLIRLRYTYFTALQAFQTNHFLWESGGLRMYPEDTLYQDTRSAFSGEVAQKFLLVNHSDDDSAAATIMRQAVLDSSPESYLTTLDSMVPPTANDEERN